MNLRDWKLRARALVAPNRVERELDEELSFHIEREAQKLVEQGMDQDEARLKARARFGSMTLAADRCRDERGTALVDNTIRDLLYAFRMFGRAPLVTVTIVVTVALGLGLITMLFTVLNVVLFRADDVPDLHEVFAVERPRLANDERPRFTRAQFDALRRETNVFADAYAELADIDTRVDGRMMSGTLVTGNAFQVLRVNAAVGRGLMPSDDERSAPQRVVVLSDRGWQRLFARDPNVLGRNVIVNGDPFEIIGVMPPGFRGLAVGAPDFWAPLSLLAEFRPIHRGREDRVGLDVIGRLKPGTRPETARAQLAVWDGQQAVGAAIERRSANIVLVPRRGTIPQPLEAIAVFSPLFFAFGLILMIGCANVANLLLARAVSRQREFGIRLSIGATRGRIVRQLLTESLLLALAAAAVGFVISRVAIEATIAAVMNSMAPDIGDVRLAVPDWDWRVVLFLLVGAIAATGFFGLMPALQATRIEPMRTLRGEVIKDARPRRSRNILIGLQVGASALLLICSAVFLRSALASAMVDPGMRTADTVIVQVINEPKRQMMVQAVIADASVMSVAASWPDALDAPRAAFAQASSAKTNVSYQFVSPEYFDVLDIPIVRGRGFTGVERSSNLSVAIVSQSTAQTLWPKGDAVGQVLQLEPDPNSPTRRVDEPPLLSRTFTVVGVARDVAGFRFLAHFEQAGVYVPTSAAMAKTSLVARVHGDPEQARQRLLDKLTIVDPNMGHVVTMRTVARMESYFLQIAFWVTLVLGALALALTLSGLFSVLSYLVEQRTKEIGVRMALGATSRNVTRLVLSQTIRPVAFGLLAGGGLAAGVATLLIATPAAATIAEVVHVTDPVAYAGSLLLIVGACLVAASIPARRAARLDPTQTLRQD
jgi:predicted permease